MIVIGFKTRIRSEEQLDKMAAFSGRFLDTLQGLTALKLLGRSEQQKIFAKAVLIFVRQRWKSLKLLFLIP